MKKYIILLLIYGAIVTVFNIVTAILVELLGSWIDIIGGYIVLFIALIFLIHVGKTISNKKVKKKYYIYISMLVGGGLLFYLLSVFFDADIRNNWVALIGANIMFLIFLIMIFDIGKTIGKNHEKLSLISKIVFSLGILSLIITNIMFIATGF